MIAGGIAISTGQAGVGAAIGVNLSYNTVTALVDGSTISTSVSQSSLPSGTSALTVSANANELLVSVGVAGAGGDKFALGGSVTVNEVMRHRQVARSRTAPHWPHPATSP